ncbi:hypothetical protein CASFOL_019590 [Castilleja foliolosa]|uniref:Uncharacterized protein n=1 Tax=Castilleja foliolosa TaxID=1961234 RepID=A0ABD3D6T9_9LAMI
MSIFVVDNPCACGFSPLLLACNFDRHCCTLKLQHGEDDELDKE